MAKRPLIFVEPLSESLTKLCEVLTPVAESENIEIIMVPTVNEAIQLISNIEASLTLMCDAKKTALLLKSIGKQLMKQKSKLMLFTKQRIPQKSLEKMMKFGLSECIVEPIQPKSALFKVKLLLRALPSADDKKDKEFSLKSIEGSGKKEDEDLDVTISGEAKQKGELEKEIKDTKKADILNAENPNLEGDIIDGKSDNELDSHYAGKVELEKTENDDFYEGEETQDNKVESHYKGDVKKTTNEFDENEHDKKSRKNDAIIDDLLKGKIKDSKLDLEEDEEKLIAKRAEEYENKKSKKDSDLNLEFEDSSEEEQELNKDNDQGDQYLRGKIRKKSQEQEEEDELQIEEVGDLGEDDEIEDLSEINKNEKEESKSKKKSGAKVEKEENKAKEKTKEEKLETEDLGDLSDLIQTKPNDEKEENIANESEVEHIDKYYRSDDLGKPLSEDKNMKGKDSTDMNLDLEEDDDFTAQRPDEISNNKSRKSTSLDLNLEQDPLEDKAKKELDETSEAYKRNKTLEDESADYNPDELRKGLQNKKEELERREKNSAQDDEAPAMGKNKIDKDHDGEDSNYKNKKLDQEELKESRNKKEWIAREEDLKKEHERETRGEDDLGGWEKITPDKKDETPEEAKLRFEKELIINKKDLGEQTIDYGFLKKEFEIIEKYGRDAVKNAYKIDETPGADGSYSSGVKGGVPYSVEISEVIIEEAPKEIQEETDTIFTPDSKGLEYAIAALNLIEDKNLKEDEIYNSVAQIILQEYLGHTAFFRLNTENQNVDLLHKIDTDFIREQFETYRHLYFTIWNEMTLPHWSDETFQAKENFFVYPVFEGIKSMGFAISFFPDGIIAEKAPRIEVLLECLRTLYLDYSHGNSTRGAYNSIENKKEEPQAISKLFGKIGSWLKKTG